MWGKLYGSAFSLAIYEAARQHDGLVLVVTNNMQETLKLERELQFYGQQSGNELLSLPDWETLPYDAFSPHQDIVSQRLKTLYRLPQVRHGILVVPAATLMQRLPPEQFVQAQSLLISVNETLDPQALATRLQSAGYLNVSQVIEHGEFAIRGSLIDLFPMGSDQPYRIDLFDDEVETIRTFDPSTQLSDEKLQQIEILPAREYPLNEAGIRQFRSQFRDRFDVNPQDVSVYRDISEGRAASGGEYYLPLFFDDMQTLFNYLPEQTLILTHPGVETSLVQFYGEVESRYEQLRHDVQRPLLSPDELYLNVSDVLDQFNHYPQVHLQHFEAIDADNKKIVNFNTEAPPGLALEPRAAVPSQKLQAYVKSFKGRILFTAESSGRREALRELLNGIDLHPKAINAWTEFAETEVLLGLSIAPFERGLVIAPDTRDAVAVISEAQVFGEKVLQTRRQKQRRNREADAIISNLAELTVGAPVVHLENGVGRYLGLVTLDIGGQHNEFLHIEYAGSDKLYVPVSSLHLISRYTGASPENAPLHRLGSEQWSKARKKAAKQARDVAAELLDVYAKREAKKGIQHEIAADELNVFASTFPFEETPDQMSAIEAVIEDLQNGRPMDRVVCGDVGFGKTEIAMRAAFVAVQNGRQVAILVPTTLLAQQHYKNFTDRFSDWPIRIESLSRFDSKKEQTTTIEALENGKVDIVIGTHKLVQRGIKFKDLGLVIIDEEQRFGVKHKEQLKAMRAEVDVLTLTATPIPRTLNMALAGLRDLSIIATPPQKRLAVKTFVTEWKTAVIQEACQREFKRGGQVYFVHNEVQTIDRIAAKLQEMIPEARIGVAHGQLPERELEKIMLDFYHQRYNLLLSTTIIESGIDVPLANTIIINRADRFGLAQLHQMRGRVGRSHHRAYAYLLIPPIKTITADAKKRLDAIESLEDLGAGFTLASHDLEIRGAGELLGQDQSGQIQEIGFTLYMEMLERAVAALKKGEQPALDLPMDAGPEITINAPAILPADYIPDVHIRLMLYKRIANAVDQDALRELQVELIDRFGLLPDATKTLFALTELKLLVEPLGVKKIDANAAAGRIVFEAEPKINIMALLQLIQQHSDTYKFDGQSVLRYYQTIEEPMERLHFIRVLLTETLADPAQTT